jgi:hypothetical protein
MSMASVTGPRGFELLPTVRDGAGEEDGVFAGFALIRDEL